MMAMLATFAYVRVLILWSYWLFSKVAKVANISTGVKVAIFEFKHGHHAKAPTKMALASGRNCAAREKTFVTDQHPIESRWLNSRLFTRRS